MNEAFSRNRRPWKNLLYKLFKNYWLCFQNASYIFVFKYVSIYQSEILKFNLQEQDPTPHTICLFKFLQLRFFLVTHPGAACRRVAFVRVSYTCFPPWQMKPLDSCIVSVANQTYLPRRDARPGPVFLWPKESSMFQLFEFTIKCLCKLWGSFLSWRKCKWHILFFFE